MARVCRLWDLPRSTVYYRRYQATIPIDQRPEPRRRGPLGACSDEDLPSAAENTAIFARVSDSDPEMLRYLADRGIRPGAQLRIVGIEPFGGPLVVEVEGREHALGEELAEKMRVEPAGVNA